MTSPSARDRVAETWTALAFVAAATFVGGWIGNVVFERELRVVEDDIADSDIGILYVFLGGAWGLFIAIGLVGAFFGLRAVRERYFR